MDSKVLNGLVTAMLHCRKQDGAFRIILEDIVAGKLGKEDLVQMPVKDACALIAFYQLGARVVSGTETIDKEELALAVLLNADPDDLVKAFDQMSKKG